MKTIELVLNIKGTKITLSVDEAVKLKDDLNDLFSRGILDTPSPLPITLPYIERINPPPRPLGPYWGDDVTTDTTAGGPITLKNIVSEGANGK